MSKLAATKFGQSGRFHLGTLDEKGLFHGNCGAVRSSVQYKAVVADAETVPVAARCAECYAKVAKAAKPVIQLPAYLAEIIAVEERNARQLDIIEAKAKLERWS